MHGSLASPRNLSGELELPVTTLRIQDLPVEVSAVRARIENGQVRAEPVTLTAQGGTLLLTGSADLVQRTIEATGKGALQLRTLSPFLGQAFLDGLAEVDVTLSGPLTAPASRGTVQVQRRPEGAVSRRHGHQRHALPRRPSRAGSAEPGRRRLEDVGLAALEYTTPRTTAFTARNAPAISAGSAARQPAGDIKRTTPT